MIERIMKVAFVRRPTAPPQAASLGDRRWPHTSPENGGCGRGGRIRMAYPEPVAA
jgi:hypothetical protein